MRRIFPLFLAISLLLPTMLFQPAPTRAQAGDASQLIAEVNGLRAAYGLPALKVNSALMSAAQKQSDYQAQIGSWTHTGPGGSSPRDRAMTAGYGGGATVFISENVAAGVNLSPSNAVYEMWQDAVHLETMISPYFTHIGAGVGPAGDWIYYTLVVGYVSGSPGSGPNPVAAPTSNVGDVPPAPTALPIEPISIATPGADGSIIHIVQSGQFLENIALAYEVNLVDLMALNGLNEQSVIFPGEQILIQAGQPTENPLGTTEVESELETVELLTPSITPTSRQETSTPTPVPVAMSIPTRDIPNSSESLERAESSQSEGGGFDFLLYAVIGLAFSGTALILFGSTMKKRS
jgi:LysM repeat protein